VDRQTAVRIAWYNLETEKATTKAAGINHTKVKSARIGLMPGWHPSEIITIAEIQLAMGMLGAFLKHQALMVKISDSVIKVKTQEASFNIISD